MGAEHLNKMGKMLSKLEHIRYNSGRSDTPWEYITLEVLSVMSIKVNPAYCPQNHRCPATRVCPVNAIIQNGVGAPTIDEEKCINCGRCLVSCPFGVFQKGS